MAEGGLSSGAIAGIAVAAVAALALIVLGIAALSRRRQASDSYDVEMVGATTRPLGEGSSLWNSNGIGSVAWGAEECTPMSLATEFMAFPLFCE
jgi:hypothetical protein